MSAGGNGTPPTNHWTVSIEGYPTVVFDESTGWTPEMLTQPIGESLGISETILAPSDSSALREFQDMTLARFR